MPIDVRILPALDVSGFDNDVVLSISSQKKNNAHFPFAGEMLAKLGSLGTDNFASAPSDDAADMHAAAEKFVADKLGPDWQIDPADQVLTLNSKWNPGTQAWEPDTGGGGGGGGGGGRVFAWPAVYKNNSIIARCDGLPAPSGPTACAQLRGLIVVQHPTE